MVVSLGTKRRVIVAGLIRFIMDVTEKRGRQGKRYLREREQRICYFEEGPFSWKVRKVVNPGRFVSNSSSKY